MKKTEFLKNLERSLDGQVPQELVVENLRYYNDYIRQEAKKGRREEDVLDELGDPRLIARSITDAEIAEEKEAGVWSEDRVYASRGNYDDVILEGYDSDGTPEYAEAPEEETVRRAATAPKQPRFTQKTGFSWDIRFVLIAVAVVLIVLAILGLFFGAAFRLLTSKVFWAVLLIWFAVRFLFRYGRK